MDATVLMGSLAGLACAVVLGHVELMDRPVRMVFPVMMDQWVPVGLTEPWELLVSVDLLDPMELPVRKGQKGQSAPLAQSVSAVLQGALAKTVSRVPQAIPVLMVLKDLLVLLVLLA